jgi:hypothetical protein
MIVNILTFISLPFDVYFSELRVLISLTGHSSSTDISIHLRISSWMKSEAVVDFLINVLTICSVKGLDFLWNFLNNSPKQISAIFPTPDRILLRQESSSVMIKLKCSSVMSYLWFSIMDRMQLIDSNCVFQLLSLIIIKAF